MIYVRVIGEEWNLISAAIRFETRCWASHVELIRVSESGMVVDVVACRWPHGLGHYPYITKGVTIEQWYDAPNLDLVWQWMDEHHSRYDLSAIFGIALDSDFHDDNRDICSESLIRGSEWAAERVQEKQNELSKSIAMGTTTKFMIGANESALPWLNLSNVRPWRVTPRDLLMSNTLQFVKQVRRGSIH